MGRGTLGRGGALQPPAGRCLGGGPGWALTGACARPLPGLRAPPARAQMKSVLLAVVFLGGLVGLLTLQVMRYTPPEGAGPMGRRSKRKQAYKASKKEAKVEARRNYANCDG